MSIDLNHDGEVSVSDVLAAVNDLAKAKTDVKSARSMILVLLFVIVAVVGATVGLTYVVVQNSVKTSIDSSNPRYGVFLDKSTGNPILVNSQVVSTNVPLGAFHLLPELLYQLHQISVEEPTSSGLLRHVLAVTEISVHPTGPRFVMMTQSGMTVDVNGYTNATVTKPDGTTFKVCAACAECLFESVPLTDAVAQALVAYNNIVPSVVDACDAVVPSNQHRRNQQRRATSAKCPAPQIAPVAGSNPLCGPCGGNYINPANKACCLACATSCPAGYGTNTNGGATCQVNSNVVCAPCPTGYTSDPSIAASLGYSPLQCWPASVANSGA